MATMTITLGRLLCRGFRDSLKVAKFQGLDIEWIESSGWLERQFTVKGPDKDIRTLCGVVEKWKAKMDAEDLACGGMPK